MKPKLRWAYTTADAAADAAAAFFWGKVCKRQDEQILEHARERNLAAGAWSHLVRSAVLITTASVHDRNSRAPQGPAA